MVFLSGPYSVYIFFWFSNALTTLWGSPNLPGSNASRGMWKNASDLRLGGSFAGYSGLLHQLASHDLAAIWQEKWLKTKFHIANFKLIIYCKSSWVLIRLEHIGEVTSPLGLVVFPRVASALVYFTKINRLATISYSNMANSLNKISWCNHCTAACLTVDEMVEINARPYFIDDFLESPR